LDENRMRDSSRENVAPVIEVVLRNCSIVYCFAGLALCVPAYGAAVAAARRQSTSPWMRRFGKIGILSSRD
jgi:hypothetical protein